MEQLIQMLRNHDFTFMYSEDHDLWMKSFAHISAIKQEICNLIASGEKLDELRTKCLELYPNDNHNQTEIKRFFQNLNIPTMAEVTYKGFPVTFTSYYQPTERELGIQGHYIVEDIKIFGIEPDELLEEDGMEELIAFIVEELEANKNSYHG
jgi:hypothetical protein